MENHSAQIGKRQENKTWFSAWEQNESIVVNDAVRFSFISSSTLLLIGILFEAPGPNCLFVSAQQDLFLSLMSRLNEAPCPYAALKQPK